MTTWIASPDLMKGVYPYDYMDSFTRFDETEGGLSL